MDYVQRKQLVRNDREQLHILSLVFGHFGCGFVVSSASENIQISQLNA